MPEDWPAEAALQSAASDETAGGYTLCPAPSSMNLYLSVTSKPLTLTCTGDGLGLLVLGEPILKPLTQCTGLRHHHWHHLPRG